jgi:aquaglyceroporin related protein
MLDSTNTQFEYSPESSPKRRDWARQPEGNPYGSRPGLTDPNDNIHNSDEAYQCHLEKQANAVGDGPTVRRPSNLPDVEHREHARSPSLSPPPHQNDLRHVSTARTNDTDHSSKSKADLEHHSTLSTVRTKIGLEPEPPIVDGHDVHHDLAWSSLRVILREPFAEFFGTFIMVLFGDASVAQVLLSAGETSAPGGNGFGSYQSISWG